MNSLDKMEDYDRLKQERDEFAAMAEAKDAALKTVADSGICNGAYTLHDKCHAAVYHALSLTGPAALHEIRAKVLEEAAEVFDADTPADDMVKEILFGMAAAERAKGEM